MDLLVALSYVGGAGWTRARFSFQQRYASVGKACDTFLNY